MCRSPEWQSTDKNQVEKDSAYILSRFMNGKGPATQGVTKVTAATLSNYLPPRVEVNQSSICFVFVT